MADVAATSTDKRSVTLLATYNTRSVHAVTHRAQQNLSDFTAVRPCFQQFAVDNVSRSNITTTSNNLLAIASARNTCYVAFQQIASKLLETEQSQCRRKSEKINSLQSIVTKLTDMNVISDNDANSIKVFCFIYWSIIITDVIYFLLGQNSKNCSTINSRLKKSTLFRNI